MQERPYNDGTEVKGCAVMWLKGKGQQKFIVEKLDLDLPLGVHKNDAPGKKSRSEKRNEFFSEISTELTQKISNVYKLDFEMFGYEKPKFQSS